MVERACDLCHGTTFQVICRRDRKGQPWNTVACRGCGLVGHESLPTEEELAAYYADSYRWDYHRETVPSPRRIWRAWLKGERVLRTLRPFLRPGQSIFEIGAGLGCTVKVFELAGFDAGGLEPGTSFQHYSATRLHARLQHGDLFSFQSERLFDVVLLIHVIEHFLSPRRALQAIHKLIRPGGLLYFECPSLGKLCGHLSELFHRAHIHTFTPITLLTMLRRCGFVVKHCFSNGDGENHKFLLKHVEPVEAPIDARGYAEVQEFIRRFQRPWHRLSLGYVAGRMRRIRLYAKEFMWGKRAVSRILRRCERANSCPVPFVSLDA